MDNKIKTFKHILLKELRERNKISQEHMVKLLYENGLDISRQTLISWENGATSPDVNHIPAISNVLGVEIGLFFKENTNLTS